jgi:hypothetical protein
MNEECLRSLANWFKHSGQVHRFRVHWTIMPATQKETRHGARFYGQAIMR